jgi:ankyrin repeat protein
VEAGADMEAVGTHGATPLMIAAAAGEALSCSALLSLGAQGDARHKFAGHTALHMAAENDWPEAISALCR